MNTVKAALYGMLILPVGVAAAATAGYAITKAVTSIHQADHFDVPTARAAMNDHINALERGEPIRNSLRSYASSILAVADDRPHGISRATKLANVQAATSCIYGWMHGKDAENELVMLQQIIESQPSGEDKMRRMLIDLSSVASARPEDTQCG